MFVTLPKFLPDPDLCTPLMPDVCTEGPHTDQLLKLARITTTGYRGDAEKVEELIKLKADLHATDALGNSPLHLAAFNGHSKVIRSAGEKICLLRWFLS